MSDVATIAARIDAASDARGERDEWKRRAAELSAEVERGKLEKGRLAKQAAAATALEARIAELEGRNETLERDLARAHRDRDEAVRTRDEALARAVFADQMRDAIKVLTGGN